MAIKAISIHNASGLAELRRCGGVIFASLRRRALGNVFKCPVIARLRFPILTKTAVFYGCLEIPTGLDLVLCD